MRTGGSRCECLNAEGEDAPRILRMTGSGTSGLARFSHDEMEEVEERALLNEGEGVIAESGSRVGGFWTRVALRKNA